MEWQIRPDGWPTLVDGSAGDWWAAQAERQRARGVVLESAQARRAALGAQLVAAGGVVLTAGTATGVGAPVGIVAGLLLAGVGTLLRSRIGGLGAQNDLDRDGRSDAQHASTLTGHVQRQVDGATALALYPNGPAQPAAWPGVRPVLERVVGVVGVDAAVVWLAVAQGQAPPEKVRYDGQSAPVDVSIPAVWSRPAARLERPQ